jgi:hypothetical protein
MMLGSREQARARTDAYLSASVDAVGQAAAREQAN